MPLERVQLSADLAAIDHYNESGVSISVWRSSAPFASAVAQADILGDRWWVSRVLVRAREQRGQGLGSIALQRMLAVIERISDAPVLVSPGGYDDNTAQQYRFYLKNGFKRVEGEPDSLLWTSPGTALVVPFT